MKNELVSVIVPIYNVEKYLRQCIESIRLQSYKNLQIILIDDGSPDLCGSIADYYKTIDNRIYVIHKKNGGLSDARNAGLNVAIGKYVFFVDSDDFIPPKVIEQLVEISEQNNADITSCKKIKFHENDTITDFTQIIDNEHNTRLFKKNEVMRIFLQGKEISTTAWGKLYRTELFSGIRYPFGKYNEDVFTTYKLMDKTEILVCTDIIGYFYRINTCGIMHSSFSEKSFDRIEGKIELANFLKHKYPYLVHYGYEGIIYACNHCYLLMCKAKYRNKQKEEEIHNYYKMYLKYYLKGNAKFRSKIFALICTLNMKLGRTIGIFINIRS